MTLRAKSLLLLAVAIFAMMGALVYISQEIMHSGFGKVEEADAKENVGRMKDAMQAQIDSLHTKLADWAAWDDAYKFVQDGNADFEKSNLNLAGMQNMKLDLMVYYNDQRKLIWGKTLNSERTELLDLSKDITDHFDGRDQIFNFKDEASSLDGIVLIGGQPWVMTAQPVVTSEQKGPIKGSLVGGRRVDEAFIQKMSQVTHLDISNARFDDGNMALDFARAMQAIGRTDQTFINRPSDEKITGYYVQYDAYASPALVMKMEKPRAINAQGVATTNIFLIALLIASILLGVAITILLEGSVLKPLTNLNHIVREIDSSGDLSLRVPVKSKDEIGQLSTAMNGMLLSIESSKNSMKLLLNNAGQGFLSFDVNGKVSTECSKAAETIFSQNPAGKNFWSLLNQEVGSWKSNIEMIFEEALDFKDLVALLPQSATISDRVIELEYRPVRNPQQKLAYVMVVATDVTRVRELQKKAEIERRTNASLVKILGSKNDFLEALELVNTLGDYKSDPVVFKRYLHTLKGSFAFLDCTDQSQVCHEWEKHLKDDPSTSAMNKAVSDIQVSVKDFTTRHAQVLNLNTTSERTLPVSMATVRNLFDEAVRMSAPQPLLRIIEQLPERPATEALSWLADAAKATADQVDKELEKFEWLPSVDIDPAPYKSLFKSLIHIVRNAVDHGLEYPDDRVQFGKPRGGTIKASLKLESNMYVLRIQDDGQGIDLDKLRDKAKNMGIPVPTSDAALLDLIFADGFSTRDEVTTTSGRGVGLSAVKAEAQKLGGNVMVKSEFGKGTEFVITFRRTAPSVSVEKKKLAA